MKDYVTFKHAKKTYNSCIDDDNNDIEKTKKLGSISLFSTIKPLRCIHTYLLSKIIISWNIRNYVR